MSTVYRFYNESSELLYVGVTDNLPARLKAHNKNKEWWTEVAFIITHHYEISEVADNIEEIAIRNEQPKYNRGRRRRGQKKPAQHITTTAKINTSPLETLTADQVYAAQIRQRPQTTRTNP